MALVGCSGALLATLAACGPAPSRTFEGIVRDRRTGQPIAGARVRVEGAATGAPSATTGADGKWTLRAPGDSELVAEAEGRCAERVAAGGSPATRPLTLHLSERLRVTGEATQVGYDREVVLYARTPCDRSPRVEWRQTLGRQLGLRMRVLDNGRRVVVRTHALTDFVTLDDRLGIVPISRREQGEYRFEVKLTGVGQPVVRQARVTAAATSSGVFQIPTGTDIYLNAGAIASPRWELISKPTKSRAELVGADTRTPRLRADRFGQYLVRFLPTRLDINIQAGDYETVPRDCGRQGCHQSEDVGWASTKHAVAFRRGIDGALGSSFDERCWPCHATGVDVGVRNGGLHDTAARLGWRQGTPGPTAWAALPRLIRRHGSVWCSACHGPGRILPPQFHWEYGAKYQAGVCARCHDDDVGPDVPHPLPAVAGWRRALMSTFPGRLAEGDPALRVGCAKCHSAQGFVMWRRHSDELYEPEPGTVAPITCAACHDPHDGTRRRALRVYDVSDPVSGVPVAAAGAGALCMSCHHAGVARAGEGAAAPHAPQADVLVGRGARLLRPQAGEAAPVHGAIAQACVTCHMAPPGAALAGRAGGHTFSVRDLDARDRLTAPLSAAACAGAGCHADALARNARAIGAGIDRDGDGATGTVAEEMAHALARAREVLRGAVARANVHDQCATPRAAVDVAERDARLVLVAADGHPLGDCNADDHETADEHWSDTTALPARVRDAAWDIALIEKDRSRGMHNPAYAFAVLTAASEFR